ncbi:DUF1223 domain-containing protein [Flavobacterium sp. SUN052]|uniref:DUF1223 domain-containing protein n=1 Tax=Flavobacterium sp. SUN052 TaxID=3002441 RepID=UPI00237D3921|nr:DUF1223 domain-containing protein [Flavobacterium sp. SUN052]MEC4005686.1 DUF1223 domain-containing protein [Flavobacterium sp. SUN052]
MKKAISSILILFAVAMMIFSVYSIGQSTAKTNPIHKTVSTGIVVLELFTSQGCSSCPPADAVLAKYAKVNDPNIITLAFHVDYWNYIGWKDPFSKAQYSQRQREYAENFDSDGVYTPQLIINGKHELVGSKESEIANLVTKETSLFNTSSIKIISSKLLENQLIVKFSALENNSNSLVNLALIKKKEFTKIKRGENNGLEQTSYSIVYDFKTVPLNNSKESEVSFNFQNDWKSSDFMIVAYIQNKTNATISTGIKSEINL